MKSIDFRKNERIRLFGRYPEEGQGVPLYWSASGAEFRLKGSDADVEIECRYQTMKPYLSFEVDGLRAQTFAPLKGKHRYSIFAGMDPQKVHQVRIIKETQPFDSDPAGSPVLLKLYIDGELQPLKPRKMKITFVGDSVTSVEGGRGPKSFQEWMPMMFSASDGYARLVSDRLKADFQVISQSGWGTYCSWDNNPNHALPKVFDPICALQAGGEAEYTGFKPDHIVIALGANDRGSMMFQAWTDPETGIVYKREDTPESLQLVEDAAYDFLLHLHQKYPNARIHWISFYVDGSVPQSLQKAIARATGKGVPVTYAAPATFDRKPGLSKGSRNHPGPDAHRRIAAAVVKLIRDSERNPDGVCP